MLLSIIIPAYKVEKYINRCLDSICSQLNDEIEVIVVDDGSPDNSGKIADCYAQNHQSVQVIHKANGGLSDARNAGFQVAKGQYVMFVDSDDYLTDDCLYKICAFLSEYPSDVYVGDANFEYETGTRGKHRFSSNVGQPASGEEFMVHEFRCNTMMMAAWLYIYRRDFMRKNNLLFKKGILHEDEEFTPRALLAAKTVYNMGIIHYNYLIRENSITTSAKKEKNSTDLFETLMVLEKQYDAIDNLEHKLILKNSLVTKYLYTWVYNDLSTKKGWKKDSSFLKRNVYGLKNKLKVRLFLLNERMYRYIARRSSNG